MKIGYTEIGPGHPCLVVAEIGINHNGSVETAKQLVTLAKDAGCGAVKFQKRTPLLCVPEAQRGKMRYGTPWGDVTYMAYREKVEFNFEQYLEIDGYCTAAGIPWFASCWDVPSVDFVERFGPPCHKVASASVTNRPLLERIAATGRPVFLSTGMSTLEQVDAAVAMFDKKKLCVLQAVSTYPAEEKELNLAAIAMLRDRYKCVAGYSGHESGIAPTVAAVAMGACVVERHVTLDRAMWGSDHAASLGPSGIRRLVRDIRLVEASIGEPVKKVMERELPVMERLRV